MTNTVDLIAQYEGFSAEPYWDHSQWSIGYGSYAGSRDRNNKPNMRVTQAQGRDMLQQQMPKYEATVDKYDSTYNWTPAERQALTSFAYNVGSIDQLTDNGRRSREEIAAAMPLYNKASQQVVPGLVRRRAAETAIFTGGTAPAPGNETKTPLTEEEQNAVRELQRSRRNLDAVKADANSSPAEIRNAQARYDEAKSNSPLSGGDGEINPNNNIATSSPSTNFSNAESLSEIVTEMEKNEEWWMNALDEYQNFAYNIELFIVNQADAFDFMFNETSNIDTIISNGWPSSDMRYITVAETAVTTEFNIQDLEITSLGAGSSSTSKLAGTATSMSFSIVQVGNTSLNDNLMNASLLSGYSSISEAKFFLKLNFKGYTDDGVAQVSEGQNLTKVFPFVISNIGDVSTGTDTRGTITTIEGTIAQDYATSSSINLIDYNFEFVIKETLQETLQSFLDKLNETIREKDFSSGNAASNAFIHEYSIEFDNDFLTEYGESKMNDETAQPGSANNTVGVRRGGVNVSEQIGNITPGLSIIDAIYDICIQSLDIRNALTSEEDTFNQVISVIPSASPKPGGLNVLTGVAGHKVTYFICTKPQIITQNNYDNANKVRNSSSMIKEIFDSGKCKKVYYHQYTGLNDQILDLSLSFNRQLVKAYNLPEDAAFANSFINGTDAIVNDLNPRAQQALEQLETQLDALQVDRDAGIENLDSIRSEIENSSESISSTLRENSRNALAEQGVDPAFRNQILDEMAGKSIAEQIEIAKQYDPDIVNSAAFNEQRQKYNDLIDRATSANTALSEGARENSRISNRRDEIVAQAMGANFSNFVNGQVSNISDNFSGSDWTNITGNSNQIIMEELGDDLISRLSTQQLEDIIEAMLINPVIFKRAVLPYLSDKQHISIFSSSDESEITLAKAKFYEAINMDISMETMKLTIKGDPYWIDTYLTPKTAKDIYGLNNTVDDKRSHPTNINGSNFVTVVVNKSAGVDEYDNTKIAQLATMLYAVKNVTSSFSGGQFTQQLEMIRIPVPDSFLPVNPFFSTVESDFGYGSDQYGEFGGIAGTDPAPVDEEPVTEVAPPSYTLPSAFGIVPNPDNLPIGAGSSTDVDENGNVGVLLDPDGAPAAVNALTANTQLLLENDGIPTAEQAEQYKNNKAQVEYYCAQGSESACIALQTSANTINNQIVNNIAGDPPYDNAQITNDINESGIDVSPEGIAILQESMIAGGHETFNADNIDGITQAEVDAYIESKNESAAKFYIGTNGIVENPGSAIQDASEIDITKEPFSTKGSSIKVISEQTGQGIRSVVTEVPTNTLTPIEYEKARHIQGEIRDKLAETPIQDMTEEEYTEVKQLETAVTDMVTAATTGERGDLLKQYETQERNKQIATLEAEEAELQDDLDSWYWTNKGRKEDEQSISGIRGKLAKLRQENIEAGFTDETEGE
jgi:GH24 family phage-related lysozyme (muramidase)